MIERIIALAASSAEPIAGDNLLGFRIDLDQAIFSAAAFSAHNVEVTADRDCVLRVDATVAENVASLQDLSTALARIFDATAYRHLMACSVSSFREETVLRFVTMPTRETYVVTGRIVAHGGPYARLAQEFEKGWYALPPRNS